MPVGADQKRRSNPGKGGKKPTARTDVTKKPTLKRSETKAVVAKRAAKKKKTKKA
jgi:hypothetical protein